ncbi:MAG: RDD family protein [Actinomycetota bacterium]
MPVTRADRREPLGEVCFSCAAELGPGARFCPECGKAQRRSGSRVGFGPRYAAILVDLTVVIGLWAVVSLLAQPFTRLLPDAKGIALDVSDFGRSPASLVNAALVPIVALVYFAFTASRGQSVGARILGFKVQTLAGTKAGPLRGLVRAACIWGPLAMILFGRVGVMLWDPKIGSALQVIGAPLFLIVSLIHLVLVGFTKNHRGLDDLASGTEVVSL